jgi:hypothetical protein
MEFDPEVDTCCWEGGRDFLTQRRKPGVWDEAFLWEGILVG